MIGLDRISTLFPYTTLFRSERALRPGLRLGDFGVEEIRRHRAAGDHSESTSVGDRRHEVALADPAHGTAHDRIFATQELDRKSTRLNSSHSSISYSDFCLKK